MTTLENAFTKIAHEQFKFSHLVYRAQLMEECPSALKVLQLIDQEYTVARQPRGFNLMKRDNKKLGFVYYVRYWHEGRMLGSKWCTHTNDYRSACEFAVANRERLISTYVARDKGEMERFFRKFYRDEKNLDYRRAGKLSERKIKRYETILINDFIPFLREKRIKSFVEITVPLLGDFQDALLHKGVKAKTVNNDMAALRRPFMFLTRRGMISNNPYLGLPKLPSIPEEQRTHGCYELQKLKGVFDRRWKDKLSYLLNLIIYTADMRNNEIQNLCKNDIIRISGCHFLKIRKSKTENGIRLVPLHNVVYRQIMRYSEGMNEDTNIFGGLHTHNFETAYLELGKKLNVDKKTLKEQYITFYSGRHFWKTMMNAGGLGEDAEELFMGHKISSDARKLYNHRDKQGRELLVKKAKHVFSILDRYIFKAKP